MLPFVSLKQAGVREPGRKAMGWKRQAVYGVECTKA